ncbi:MAG: N-acetylmuramoyl-L-alanine amidase/N-acetylmuramoyl-L-alanine amidase [Chloroflexi bacterium]|nr:MAG: N-acetylmuramoyl-L-alanine amidase/N-acetylmuramoyl-L-alanine amidase [Chloroflexota bacterium]
MPGFRLVVVLLMSLLAGLSIACGGETDGDSDGVRGSAAPVAAPSVEDGAGVDEAGVEATDEESAASSVTAGTSVANATDAGNEEARDVAGDGQAGSAGPASAGVDSDASGGEDGYYFAGGGSGAAETSADGESEDGGYPASSGGDEAESAPSADAPEASDPDAGVPEEPVPEASVPEAGVPEGGLVLMEPRRPVVVLDPGHGGTNVGAVRFGVVERESNLDFALRVEQLLIAAGYDVILTRRTAARTVDVSEASLDEVPEFLINRPDLQGRVDLANEAEADLFISIHSNGAADPRASGIEVYWDAARPHAAENERLALALHESILDSLEIATGYRAWDRGIQEDTCWHISERTGECSPIFVLGPPDEIDRSRAIFFGLDPAMLGFAPGQDVLVSRATQMPAALLELLFITNEWEAGVLKDEASRQGIAVGIVRGIERYFLETASVSEQDGGGQEGAAQQEAGAGAG